MGILSRQPSRVKAIKTRLYELIDRATSEYLSAPNFALNTDVVSAINGAPEPTYAANKACKRIHARLVLRNPRVQQLALQLLEHCVRSCGEGLHRELAKSELFVELLRLADRSSWSTAQLQAQVLSLIQEWAYTLKPAQFSNAFNKLKARGLPFPPRDGTHPPPFEPYPGLSPPPPVPMPPGGHYPPHPGHHAHHAGHITPEDAGPPQLLAPGQPPAKLKEDLGVAGNTVALLQEVLDGVPQDNFAAAKEEYVTDMVTQCREMKERLTRLISRLEDETLLVSALQLNDDAQAALDRHADMVAVAEGRRRPPPSQPRPAAAAAAAAREQPPAQQQPVAKQQQPSAAAAAAAKPAPPLMDLLSLDNWGPGEAGPSYPPVSTVMGPAGSAGVADPFALPMPAAPAAASNNPFAAPPPAAVAPPPPPAPSLPAAAPRAAAPPAADANPFFSDTAFGAALQPAAAAAAAAPAAHAAAGWDAGRGTAGGGQENGAHGNPFAAGPAAPPGAALPPETAAASPSRGSSMPLPHLAAGSPAAAAAPPLSPNPSFGYPAVQSPAVGAAAPLYGGSLYQAPPPTYSTTPFGGTPPPVNPGPYGRPLSDAFGDLVTLSAPKEEPAPPPPRGTPMRTPVGLSPEPSAAAAAAAPPAADKSALSAFDMFDELATRR